MQVNVGQCYPGESAFAVRLRCRQCGCVVRLVVPRPVCRRIPVVCPVLSCSRAASVRIRRSLWRAVSA